MGGSEPDHGRRRRERMSGIRTGNLNGFRVGMDLVDRGDNGNAAASTGYLRKQNFLNDSTASVMYQKIESRAANHDPQTDSPSSTRD